MKQPQFLSNNKVIKDTFKGVIGYLYSCSRKDSFVHLLSLMRRDACLWCITCLGCCHAYWYGACAIVHLHNVAMLMAWCIMVHNVGMPMDDA